MTSRLPRRRQTFIGLAAIVIVIGAGVAVASLAPRGPTAEQTAADAAGEALVQRIVRLDEGASIDLATALDRAWNRAVVIPAYLDGDEMDRALGFDWFASDAWSGSDESQRRVLFVAGQTVVADVTASPDTFRLDIAAGDIDPSEAVFVASHVGGLVTLSPATRGSLDPAAVAATLSDEEIAAMIADRKRFGLRHDEAWVRRVAADPTSDSIEMGIPLTLAEVADIRSRRWDEDLFLKVRGYCLGVPDDCAGAYINFEGTGVVLMFAHRAKEHRQFLVDRVGDPTLIAIREVEWSLSDLEGFIHRLEADKDWYESIGVEFVQTKRRITEDFVRVEYRAPSDQASAAIAARYGNPAWLRVEWTPSEWAGPRGRLVIRVVDTNGRPVPGVGCELISEDPRVPAGSDMRIGTDRDGILDLPNMPTVAYRIRLSEWVDNDHDEFVKEVRVVHVSTGSVVNVVIPAR